jgi:hypothetical protein
MACLVKESAFYYKKDETIFIMLGGQNSKEVYLFPAGNACHCKHGFLGLQRAIPTLVATWIFNK